jgi:hypothetical protein
MSRNDNKNSRDTKPWWKYPMVWLVIGGPAIVVVAGITTAVIAYRHVDPVLDISAPAKNAGQMPAMKGRNKAAETATQPAER